MALDTYSNLTSAIAEWYVRSNDTAFIARIPDFITLFEAEANRRLRVRQMIASTNLSFSSGDATLPTDFIAFQRVEWMGSARRVLEYYGPDEIEQSYPAAESGVPSAFTIVGTTLTIRPIDNSTTITMKYYQRLTALSSTASNWLFAAYPDAYLFGALTEAAAYDKNPEAAVLWKARRDETFESVKAADAKWRGPAPMRAYGVYTP